MRIVDQDPHGIHGHVIHELAEELHCADDVVAEIYLHEVDGLVRNARVSDYIPVFAARRTRERIRRGGRQR